MGVVDSKIAMAAGSFSGEEAWSLRTLVSGAGIPFASLPAASGDARAFRVSNVGPRGSLWLADGVDWAPQGGRVLLGRGVDIGGNRTITGSTTETSVYSLVIPGGVMGSFGTSVGGDPAYWTAIQAAIDAATFGK